MLSFICHLQISFLRVWKQLCVHKQADTTTKILAAFALICLWCHLFPLSHLWLADCYSICSVSWLVLLAQGGGLSEALWIMDGCPDNPCNVDSLSESNMAVRWQCSLKWRTWWLRDNAPHILYSHQKAAFVMFLINCHYIFWQTLEKIELWNNSDCRIQ